MDFVTQPAWLRAFRFVYHEESIILKVSDCKNIKYLGVVSGEFYIENIMEEYIG